MVRSLPKGQVEGMVGAAHQRHKNLLSEYELCRVREQMAEDEAVQVCLKSFGVTPTHLLKAT